MGLGEALLNIGFGPVTCARHPGGAEARAHLIVCAHHPGLPWEVQVEQVRALGRISGGDTWH